LNIDRVLSIAMDRPGTFTRAELIELSGLSAPTIGEVAGHLIRKGVVKDLGTGPSSGGRRPSLMEFNARHAYTAVMDIGPTRTRLAVADLRGETIQHEIVDTPKGVGPQEGLSHLAADLLALLERTRIPRGRLLAVAAGAPGIVGVKEGTLVLAPNLTGWRDVPMRDILAATLRTTVVVENDVNLALLGEHWRGAARGHESCAFVFVGTGIGAAVLIDGVLLHGHHDMAGEIAVMCMGPEFVDRDFGGRGCLETLAGLDALKARWPDGVPSDPERWIPSLLEAARSGDAQAQRAVEETARMIGIATANIGAVVDPSVVVLGGAMFAQAEPLADAVRDVVRRLQRNPFDVVLSQLGKEAPVAGGLLVAVAEARRQLTHQLELSVARSAHP
jgi:glucokinase